MNRAVNLECLMAMFPVSIVDFLEGLQSTGIAMRIGNVK